MSDVEQYEPLEHAVSILEKVAADYRALRAENEKLRAAQEQLGLSLIKINGRGYYVSEPVLHEVEKLRAALKPFKEELEAQIEEVPHITDCNEIFHNYGLRYRLHKA